MTMSTTPLPSCESLRTEIVEDHVQHSGIVKVTIAADISNDQARRVVQAIEDVRPAGVRIWHNLVTEPPADAASLPESGAEPAILAPATAAASGGKITFSNLRPARSIIEICLFTVSLGTITNNILE